MILSRCASVLLEEMCVIIDCSGNADTVCVKSQRVSKMELVSSTLCRLDLPRTTILQ
jgi:hypothetical protein